MPSSKKSLDSSAFNDNRPRYNIVGGGITGIMTALYLLKNSDNEPIRIRMIEGDNTVAMRKGATSSAGLVASLTPDEDLVVVNAKNFEEFEAKLRKDCEKLGHNEDVIGLEQYLDHAADYFYGLDQHDRQQREHIVEQTGRLAMEYWDELYNSDPDLAKIMDEAGFYNPLQTKPSIISGIDDAANKAVGLAEYCQDVMQRGDAQVLSPADYIEKYPALASFARNHCGTDNDGNLTWKEGCHGGEANGGCIIPEILMPRLLNYLKDKAKQNGSNFEFIGNARVNELKVENGQVTGLDISQKVGDDIQDTYMQLSTNNKDTVIAATGAITELTQRFTPNVSTARFAGASLVLDVPADKLAAMKEKGVTLPKEGQSLPTDPYYTARDGSDMMVTQVALYDPEEGNLHIGAGGEKAFYGTKKPKLGDDFINQTLIQHAKTICTSFPEIFSELVGRDIAPDEITIDTVNDLVQKGYARPWAGARHVTSRLTPIIGRPDGVSNLVLATGVSSGGVAKGTVNAQLAADLAANKHNPMLVPYAQLCNPKAIEVPQYDVGMHIK